MVTYLLVLKTSKRKALQSLLFFVGDNIYPDNRNDNDNPNYIRICDKSTIKLLKTVLTVICMICFICSYYYIIPIAHYILTKEVHLPVPILCPFTNLISTNGILINVVNQMFMCFYGLSGMIGIEIIQLMLKNTVWASTLAICHSIDEFSLAIEHSNVSSTITVHYLFRNILIQVQDVDRYVLDNF